MIAEPLWHLTKDGHGAEAGVRVIDGIGVELRYEWNGDLRVSQMFKAWDALEAAATEKRQAAANPWLQRLIIAALETGCRRGELLSLQWQEVSLTRNELTIRAEKAKDGDRRTLPISARLKAVLEMIKVAPDGKEHSPAGYVFGDAVGGHIADPKKAWAATCKRAEISELHFHDLRHEAGSRLLEAGWPLHHVQEMLGHADLKQTSTYLNVTRVGLQDSMKRFGTAPLHSVAPEADPEHPAACIEPAANKSQVTVN